MKQLSSRTTRHRRIRARLTGSAEKPRASVFRSNRSLVVQLVDDAAGKTLVAVYGQSKAGQTKTDQAVAIGKELAQKAKAAGITRIVFDRGGYKYHGRVAALATAMRESGLDF